MKEGGKLESGMLTGQMSKEERRNLEFIFKINELERIIAVSCFYDQLKWNYLSFYFDSVLFFCAWGKFLKILIEQNKQEYVKMHVELTSIYTYRIQTK